MGIGSVLELLNVLIAGAFNAFLALQTVNLLVEEFRVRAALSHIEVTRARHLVVELLLSLCFH